MPKYMHKEAVWPGMATMQGGLGAAMGGLGNTFGAARGAVTSLASRAAPVFNNVAASAAPFMAAANQGAMMHGSHGAVAHMLGHGIEQGGHLLEHHAPRIFGSGAAGRVAKRTGGVLKTFAEPLSEGVLKAAQVEGFFDELLKIQEKGLRRPI